VRSLQSWTTVMPWRFWTKKRESYWSIANSAKTHATKRCGTALTPMSLGVYAKVLAQETKLEENELQAPISSSS
jgi:hypothetical protein